MADPNLTEFYSRVRRIEKARAKGFGFEAAGTLGRSFYHKQGSSRHGWLKPLILLMVPHIGQKAEITVSDQEMTQAVMRQARQYPGQERQYFEFVQKNPQMQQQLRAPIFEDKVVDHIVAGAKVTDKEVSKEELQKFIEALDEM